MQRNAVNGIVDDLCHALGVRKADVTEIHIRPGTVEVIAYTEDRLLTWPLLFTWDI